MHRRENGERSALTSTPANSSTTLAFREGYKKKFNIDPMRRAGVSGTFAAFRLGARLFRIGLHC